MPFFSQASERLIVQGCLKNERYYQKMLFDRYKDAMYTVVFRMLRNEAQACDAVQEGFIQVFTCLATYRFQSSLGSWIKTIMIRCALRILEKESLQPVPDKIGEDAAVTWDENLTGEQLDGAKFPVTVM